jgi:hypothetical protein
MTEEQDLMLDLGSPLTHIREGAHIGRIAEVQQYVASKIPGELYYTTDMREVNICVVMRGEGLSTKMTKEVVLPELKNIVGRAPAIRLFAGKENMFELRLVVDWLIWIELFTRRSLQDAAVMLEEASFTQALVEAILHGAVDREVARVFAPPGRTVFKD